MRSYIFTKRERKILRAWLRSEADVKVNDVAMTLSRVKHFTDLRNDVLLYIKICQKLGIPTQHA